MEILTHILASFIVVFISILALGTSYTKEQHNYLAVQDYDSFREVYTKPQWIYTGSFVISAAYFLVSSTIGLASLVKGLI